MTLKVTPIAVVWFLSFGVNALYMFWTPRQKYLATYNYKHTTEKYVDYALKS